MAGDLNNGWIKVDKHKRYDESEEEESNDEIRLYESGWKERYYQAKFGMSETNVEFRRKVAWAYAEGLCWVLKYYYQVQKKSWK